MAAREKQIGKRLRTARLAVGFSQAELARDMGIDSARLRSYELGFNPAPFWIAHYVAMQTDHCQRWLATGQLPSRPAFFLSESLEASVRNLPFSKGFETVMAGDIETTLRSVASEKGCPVAELRVSDFDSVGQLFISASDRRFAKFEFLLARLNYVAEPSRSFFLRFYKELFEENQALFEDVANRLIPGADPARPLCGGQISQPELQTLLANAEARGKSSDVHPPRNWQELKQRLLSRVSMHGTRSALARHLGVTPQAVSAWLVPNGVAPSADLTLRLLAWVSGNEAPQKKRSASAETPAEQETQQKHTTNAKRSGPKGKT